MSNGSPGDLGWATGGGSSHALLGPIADLLRDVRELLKMDVAFVSRFVDQRRLFEVVSVSGDAGGGPVREGAGDPLLDTYCQAIVEGRLPPIIGDTSAHPEAMRLAITEQLGIRAYLAEPVRLPNGEVFGTVCCISHTVRPDLKQSDLDALRAVAEAVASTVTKSGAIRTSPLRGEGA